MFFTKPQYAIIVQFSPLRAYIIMKHQNLKTNSAHNQYAEKYKI